MNVINVTESILEVFEKDFGKLQRPPVPQESHDEVGNYVPCAIMSTSMS